MGVFSPHFAFFGQKFTDEKTIFQQFTDSPKFRGGLPPPATTPVWCNVEGMVVKVVYCVRLRRLYAGSKEADSYSNSIASLIMRYPSSR